MVQIELTRELAKGFVVFKSSLWSRMYDFSVD